MRNRPGLAFNNKAGETIIMLRQAEAVKLRIKGKTYRQIAEELDISLAQAHADVKANLAAGAAERAHDTEEARELELMRLDNAIEKVTGILERELPFQLDGLDPEEVAALVGDASELVLKAADRLVKLSSERSKLLGLYAAEKRDQNVYLSGDVTPEMAAQKVREKFGDHASKRESAEAAESQSESDSGEIREDAATT